MVPTKRLEHLHAAELPLEEDGVVQGVERADHADQEHLEATWRRQREQGRARFRHPRTKWKKEESPQCKFEVQIVHSQEQKFQ